MVAGSKGVVSAMTTSEAIAQAALKEHNIKLIDPVQHGEVTFTIRHGRVTYTKVIVSIPNQETA